MTSYRAHPKLASAMDQAVQLGIFPGGVLLVCSSARMVHFSAHGWTSLFPPGRRVTVSTCFDLASLTKVLATTSLVLCLVQRGYLTLDDRISSLLPEYRGKGRKEITITHLLEHSSGLAAWRPYFEEVAAAAGGSLIATVRGRDAVRAMLVAEVPGAPPGKSACYSDLGYMLLEWAIERAGGKPFDVLFQERIARPLVLNQLFFIDLKQPGKASRVRKNRVFAATERCLWRGRTLVGEVHDDNAYAMGGVSGHSGLFGDARAVAKLASLWLDSYRGSDGKFDSWLVRRFWQRSSVPGSTRAMGFDTPSAEGSTAGSRFGTRSVGHTGFTGTSLWIDPDRELIVVLLTNRVHPTRENEGIKSFRPTIHDLVVEVFG